MKKTGELLKAAREAKGLSLHEIGLSLKINAKILKSIEDGDTSGLPAKTFLRGFVKSYASYLKLNVDDVLNAFTEEMGSTKPQTYIRETLSTAEESASAGMTPLQAQTQALEKPLPVTHGEKVQVGSEDPAIKPLSEEKNTKSLVFTVIGIILFALIVFTKKMIDKYSKEAEVAEVSITEPLPISVSDSTTPSEPAPEAASAGASTAVSAPAATTTAAPTSSPSPSAAPSTAVATNTASTVKATTATTSAPAPAPSVAATSSSALPAAPTKPVVPNSAIPVVKPSLTPPAPAPATTSATATAPATQVKEAPQKGKPVELIVEALDAVEIEYSSASGKVNKIKLSPEQIHTFKSRDGLSVKISNGGAVNLIHNGRDLGIPGDLGKPVKLNY